MPGDDFHATLCQRSVEPMGRAESWATGKKSFVPIAIAMNG